jgi:dynein heavy chain
MVKFMRKNCLEPVATVDNNIVQSLMRILDCYFNNYVESEIKKVTEDELEELENYLEHFFVFALVWSIGCTTNLEGREKFDRKLRTLIPPNLNMPGEGYVYDYLFDQKEKDWVIWT